MNYTLRGVLKPLSTGDREKNEVIYNDENEFITIMPIFYNFVGYNYTHHNTRVKSDTPADVTF